MFGLLGTVRSIGTVRPIRTVRPLGFFGLRRMFGLLGPVRSIRTVGSVRTVRPLRLFGLRGMLGFLRPVRSVGTVGPVRAIGTARLIRTIRLIRTVRTYDRRFAWATAVGAVINVDRACGLAAAITLVSLAATIIPIAPMARRTAVAVVVTLASGVAVVVVLVVRAPDDVVGAPVLFVLAAVFVVPHLIAGFAIVDEVAGALKAAAFKVERPVAALQAEIQFSAAPNTAAGIVIDRRAADIAVVVRHLVDTLAVVVPFKPGAMAATVGVEVALPVLAAITPVNVDRVAVRTRLNDFVAFVVDRRGFVVANDMARGVRERASAREYQRHDGGGENLLHDNLRRKRFRCQCWRPRTVIEKALAAIYCPP